MLDALRRSAGSWVVKVLLGLLVVSFAVWGVGDIFRMGGQTTLAEIGNRSISPQAFQRDYQNQISMVSNRMGRQMTAQEARQYGVGKQVLDNMIATTAIDIHADRLKLGISDATVINAIKSEPSFNGANGEFDPQRFQEVLRNLGVNEAGLIALQREDMTRQQLISALGRTAFVPKTLLDAFHHYTSDERVLKYFVLPPSSVGEVTPPDDAALTAYYNDNKNSYKAPEYRKVGVLLLTPEGIKDTIALTDEDLKAAFESTKPVYSTPERRTIQQLIFKDLAAARDGAAKLGGGTDFMALGKEIGMKDSDIALGTFTKAQLADKKLAEAAFALAENKPSEPVESFSTRILRVTKIEPGSEKTFDEVKDQVRDALARSRASQEITKLYDAIEDERASGAKVSEAAQKLNLKFSEYGFDRRGVQPDGQPADPTVATREILNLAFTSDVGVENNPLTVGDGYAFVDVHEITPERQKTFDEVKEAVKTAWVQDETRKRVRAKADELVEKAKISGIDPVAAEVKAEVVTTPPVKREAAPQGLPRTGVALAFTLPKDGVGTVQMPDRLSQAVLQVTEITPAPALDEKQAETMRDELRRGLGVDILSQYVEGLKKSYGVVRNEKAMNAIIGE